MAQLYSQQTLHYLDILLKHGNFTKAAKDLYVSQPHLTQTIKRIEIELGAKIINRDVTPLQLTAAGKVYHQYLMTAEIERKSFGNSCSNIPIRIKKSYISVFYPV